MLRGIDLDRCVLCLLFLPRGEGGTADTAVKGGLLILPSVIPSCNFFNFSCRPPTRSETRASLVVGDRVEEDGGEGVLSTKKA